jgi:membrane associated rhomboid family serine protease
MLFWIAFIGISELCAGLLAAYFLHRPRWMASIARIVGGFLLCWFADEFSRGIVAIHPIPIAAFIGGCVLICKGMVSLLRRDA